MSDDPRLLSEIRNAVSVVDTDPQILALRFRHEGDWSDGTHCRFSVRDVNRDSTGRTFTRLSTDPMKASLRLLHVHPQDAEPGIGSSTDFKSGPLVLGYWSDESDFLSRTDGYGQRAGVCRIVDRRAYPVLAQTTGQVFRMYIRAQTALSETAGSQDVQIVLGASHAAHVTPGIRLEPGAEIVTEQGDQYTVVPPVQRDVLGDTLGLAWKGKGDAVPIPEPTSTGPVPTPAPTPAPAAESDDYMTRSP